MHIDLDQAQARTYESAVCIVGAGIAGLTLATRLADRGIEVHLLEAGGLEQEERSQALYATEQAGTTHRGATDGRFRTFGGSSTQWGGQLLPFRDDTFSPWPGAPSRAWPVQQSELEPYYADIQTIFGADALPFDASLLPALGRPPVPLPPTVTLRFSKWAPFARRNVARTLGPIALASPKITLFTHANAASLLGEGGTVRSVRVLNYAGAEFHFRARHVIVAAGTIESCRLLLSSTAAVADPHDQLGRYFNDHLAFHAGQLHSPARERILDRLGPFFVAGTLHTCKLEASAQTQAEEHLHAAMAHVIVLEPEDSGTAAIRNLLRSLQAGRLKEAIAVNLLPMLRGAGDVARLVIGAKLQKRRAVSKRARVLLNVEVEQAPDANNRIRLATACDSLGLPVAIVDWRVNPADHDTALRYTRIVRAALADLGMTSIDWHETVDRNQAPPLLDTYHAMGGLCMGDDETRSVVDRDLRVHQAANVHVASCAVFPSGSSSNPTFTMMALTLRLADHLVTLLT